MYIYIYLLAPQLLGGFREGLAERNTSTDSSSAKALAQRRGVGRLKHVDLRHLMDSVLRETKVGEIEEGWNSKQCGRFEH